MDILAARKKAAERARAGKTEPPVTRPASEQTGPDDQAAAGLPAADAGPEETVASFPPVPETTFIPDEPGRELELPAAQERPADEHVPAVDEQASGQAAVLREESQGAGLEQELEQEREMLAFLLGNEEYAVPVDKVQEVLTPREITPVPHTPPYVLGVCSLRGVVLPVIDMHRRLGLAEAAWDEKSRIIVIGLGRDDRMGLFVDRVRGVVRFLPSAVRPVPETIEQGAEFLQGIVRREERLFILLDIEKTVEI